MAWITPKTDWVPSDYFNKDDYNRIIGNIAYLKEIGIKLYTDISIADMGEEKTYESMIYASEINKIEANVESINLKSYSFDVGITKTFYANQSTINYEELNRIESAILLLYKTFVAQEEALPRLSFALGGQKGVRV